jgi:hypothetical protein
LGLYRRGNMWKSHGRRPIFVGIQFVVERVFMQVTEPELGDDGWGPAVRKKN